jgi:hypothetical protein
MKEREKKKKKEGKKERRKETTNVNYRMADVDFRLQHIRESASGKKCVACGEKAEHVPEANGLTSHYNRTPNLWLYRTSQSQSQTSVWCKPLHASRALRCLRHDGDLRASLETTRSHS